MVICTKCQTRNSLDSAFCKHCGAEMDAAEVSAEKQKVEELVGEGFRLFNEGRVDEARLIAQKALEDLPDYTNALSLMGMCHERAGELNEALTCYEKIVEINPDSSLDKIKITQLRNAMAAKLIEAPAPSRGRAAVGAIAATLLVISSGIALAGFISSRQDNKPQASNTPVQQQQQPLGLQQPNNQQTQQDPQQGNNSAQQPNNQQTQQNPQQGNNGGGTQTAPIRPNGGVGEMPNVNTGLQPLPIDPNKLGVEGPGQNNPGNTLGTQNQNTSGNGGGNSGNNGGNNPTNTGGGTVDPNAPDLDSPKPPKKRGVIEIKVENAPANSGGSQPVEGNSPNQKEALLQTARQQYLTGKYDQAARTYEQALRAGADPATTNQRLGQCYEKTGRNSDAIQAYARAVQAAQSQMSSGGNRERLQNLIDACQQALQVLRGG